MLAPISGKLFLGNRGIEGAGVLDLLTPFGPVQMDLKRSWVKTFVVLLSARGQATSSLPAMCGWIDAKRLAKAVSPNYDMHPSTPVKYIGRAEKVARQKLGVDRKSFGLVDRHCDHGYRLAFDLELVFSEAPVLTV